MLSLTGIALVIAGGFAIFLSATGAFLPQDVDFLGMAIRDLCKIGQCRTVHFMIHDRVSFGGVLIATGTLYLWLAEFPLKEGKCWAWWTFFVSGLTGFSSFLAYLGYGYLDTWLGAATLSLLPVFAIGMTRSFTLLQNDKSPACLWTNLRKIDLKNASVHGYMVVVHIAPGVAGAILFSSGMVLIARDCLQSVE